MTRPGRVRPLPDLPKALVDDLELTFALAQRHHPELVSFTDWLAALLLEASRAVRVAYEAREVGIGR